MRRVTLYGLACAADEEVLLLHRINTSLAKIKRTTSKAKSKSLLQARLPFVLSHYFWNLNKDAGVYTEFYPNEDLNGNWHQPNHRDKAWLMMVIVKEDRFRNGTPMKKTAAFVQRMLKATGFKYQILAEADEREEIEA